MKYIKIAELGLKRVFAYKASIVLLLIANIASVFILQKFWLALYGNDSSQYLYMANYAIVSQILGIAYRIHSPNILSANIRDGSISVQLLRPWEYINALLFEDIGAIIGNLLSSGIVFIVSAKVLFNMQIPPVENIFLFLLSAFLGFMLFFLVGILVSMACFWVIEASSLLILISVVVDLLSGQFLPSWLMPAWLEKIMNVLPFVWIYQKPISIYMGSPGDSSVVGIDYFRIILLQLGWIIGLYVLVLVIWRIAVKKLSVQGG